MKVKFDIRIVFLAFISSLLLSAPQAYAAPEKSVSERIIEILKERGILKEEEYEELKQLVKRKRRKRPPLQR